MRLKTLKIIFHSLVMTINVIVVILFVMSAYSDRIPPEKSILFSYLGLVFPILFFVNSCFVIYWLFLGEWKFLLLSVVSLVICAGPIKNYFPIHGRTKNVPDENVIKVLTYNVMSFSFKNHTKDEPNQLINYIAGSDADLVCMQEYVEYTSTKYLTSQKLANALSMYPYRSFIVMNQNKHRKTGVALYSKYPILNSREIKYDSDFNGSAIFEVNIDGRKVTVVNNHLESFRLTMEDKKHYSEFIKNAGSDTFDGLKETIQQKLGPAFEKRAQQARIVADEIKKSDSEYIIVCGDFNDTPVSYARRTIKGNLQDAFSSSGKGMGITYNENFFWFRIDHILYSPNMKAINCTVDKVRYSDHYPLWTYLQFKD